MARTERVARGLAHLAMAALVVLASVVLCAGWAHASSASDAASDSQPRTVRVGYYSSPGFQEYDEETGTYSGSSYEYILALNQYAGWNIEFVPCEFADAVKMLETGEIDLVNNVSKTDERLQTMNFSDQASGSNYGCLIVRHDDTKYAYNDYESFDAMTVGVYANSIFIPYFESYCEERGIAPKVVSYETDAEAAAAFESGEVDARLVSSSYDDDSRVVAKFAPMDYYFATPKAETELHGELNRAMEQVNINLPNLMTDLEKKYAVGYVEENVVLSAADRAYLETDPVVRVAVSDDWYPISYFDEKGTFSGPLAAIYQALGERCGLTFEYVKCATYDEALELFRNGGAEVIAEFPFDFVFGATWNARLTDAIESVAVYRVVNQGTYTGDVSSVALFGDTYLNEQVRKRYGDDVEYVMVDNAQEAVDAVMSGKADCTHLNYYEADQFQNEGRYLSLDYDLIPALEYSFCIGISSAADPALTSIVSKGLQTLDEDEIGNMFESCITRSGTGSFEMLFYQHTVPAVLILCAVAFLVALAVAAWVSVFAGRKKNAELVRAKNAQSAFLSQMSHDMRTPMNGILGLTELLRNRTDPNDIRRDVDQIEQSGRYLLGLINDTLDMSRIESGKLELHPVQTTGGALIDNTIATARVVSAQKGVELVTRTRDERTIEALALPVMADAARVEQVFMNVVTNAVKFTPKGGSVTLDVRAEAVTDDEVSFLYTIADTGIGMSEEFLRHLYEPFSQEGRSDTNRESGTGLGLAIVHQIVECMGGSISCKSTMGQGTTFTIGLRFARTTQVAEEPPRDEANLLVLAGKRVLLAEDNPLNVQIATRLLAAQGIVCEHAADGQVCVEMFERSEPGYFDAILMDIRMPRMTGIEATRAIRALPKRPDAARVPIIAMTANAFDEDVRQTREAGMNAHLAKPIESGKLYTVLASFFSARA